ncbi:unnamed protein product, partial [Amoebophrya sp. A25]|eukprot:GSA25T00022136001.1
MDASSGRALKDVRAALEQVGASSSTSSQQLAVPTHRRIVEDFTGWLLPYKPSDDSVVQALRRELGPGPHWQDASSTFSVDSVSGLTTGLSPYEDFGTAAKYFQLQRTTTSANGNTGTEYAAWRETELASDLPQVLRITLNRFTESGYNEERGEIMYEKSSQQLHIPEEIRLVTKTDPVSGVTTI